MNNEEGARWCLGGGHLGGMYWIIRDIQQRMFSKKVFKFIKWIQKIRRDTLCRETKKYALIYMQNLLNENEQKMKQ